MLFSAPLAGDQTSLELTWSYPLLQTPEESGEGDGLWPTAHGQARLTPRTDWSLCYPRESRSLCAPAARRNCWKSAKSGVEPPHSKKTKFRNGTDRVPP